MPDDPTALPAALTGGGPPLQLGDVPAMPVLVDHPPGEGESPSPQPADDDEAAALAHRRLTAIRAAHDEKLRRAGRFAGKGYPRAWIADRFNVGEQTVANWEKEFPFLEGFAAEEERLSRAATLGLSKIALSLDALIDRALQSALGHEKDSSADRRYLIDKVLTPMTVSHNITEHRGGERFFEPIAQALVTLAGRTRPAIPLVIEGSVAAEDYGASAVANGAAVLASRERVADPSLPPPSTAASDEPSH